MRANVNLWWILVGFFLFTAVLYTGWNVAEHWATHAAVSENPWVIFRLSVEWVGTIALLFTALMGALIAFYLGRVHHAQRGELPEDVLTADIDDGEPEQGHFSPWSWWPIVLATAAAFAMLGLAIGTWLAFIGGGIFVIAIVGWVFEYYRGYHAR